MVSREELKGAEEAFLRFQRTKEPFDVCRRILESGACSPYLKYQAATCLKNSIIRDWGYLKEEGRHVQLLQYLLEYVTNHINLSHFIREQLLLVAAILLKRIGIHESTTLPRLSDDTTNDPHSNSIVSSVLSSVISMQCTINPSLVNSSVGDPMNPSSTDPMNPSSTDPMNPSSTDPMNPSSTDPMNPSSTDSDRTELSINLHRMLTATQYLLAVLFEYSSSTRTSDFGIPWIKHLEAKKRFERRELKQVFTSTLDTLNSILTHLHPLLVPNGCQSSFSSTSHQGPSGSGSGVQSSSSFPGHAGGSQSCASLSGHAGVSQSYASLSGRASELYLKSLELLEMIFTWNFDIITIISSQYATHVDSIETPSFQPNIDWREMLINDNVISFLFHLYHFSKTHLGNERMVHHTLQTLSQLSTLTGAIICESKTRLKFVNLLLSGLINMARHSSFESYEVVAISSIIYRLSFHLQNRDTLDHIDPSVKIQLADIVTTISCEIFLGNLRLDQDKFASEDGADRYKQSVENICTAWSVLLQALERNGSEDGTHRDTTHRDTTYKDTTYNPSSSSFDEKSPGESDGREEGKCEVEIEMLRSSARKVFTCYLKCHLTKPEGYREILEDSDEIEDFQEDDMVYFNDQLNTIGALARVDLSNSIDDLSNLLIIRINQLQSMVHSLSTPHLTDNNNSANTLSAAQGSSSNQIIGSHEWCCLNEDLHWLILISSWTLSQSTWLGDRDLIPDSVTALSLHLNSNIPHTLAALKSLDINPLNIHTVDPVVRIIIIILKLVRMEQCSIENHLHFLSPELSSTLTLFINKFMTVYLMPREDCYKELSMNLISCFGKDTESSIEILNFLLKHLIIKITTWSTDPSVREQAALMLVLFIKESKDRARAVMDSHQIHTLLQPLFNNQIQCYTVGTRKSLYHLVVLLASSNTTIYDNLFSSLRTKYNSILSLTQSQDDLNELNRLALTDLCDSLIGITHACNPENSLKLWNELLGPIYINEIPKLMAMYRNYNLVIASLLEFVQSLTARLLCFLPTRDTLRYYDATVEILQIYAKSNQGRYTNEPTTVEETSLQITLILQTLNDLSSKDFIDWFPTPPSLSSDLTPNTTLTSEQTDNTEISATQIVFLGLNILLPLLTPQLLQYPELSINYYKLVTYLCEDADRLVEVPQTLLDSLMLSLQHALKST